MLGRFVPTVYREGIEINHVRCPGESVELGLGPGCDIVVISSLWTVCFLARYRIWFAVLFIIARISVTRFINCCPRINMSPPSSYNVAAKEKRPEIISIAKTLRGIPDCEEYEKMVSGMLYVSSYPRKYTT